ncbi:MAG TPA: 2'-5' RNA ligase family protein [Verrucomicrobiae bacterium]|jgi:2'-5' RNA ligase
MAGSVNQAQDLYEELWGKAAGSFDKGGPTLDPFLKNRAADNRRGVTLVARPGLEVCAGIQRFSHKIAAVAPDQHFYTPEEYHVTVLAVIPGSEFWQTSIKRLPEYLATLDNVLSNRPAFSINFQGVTASPDAIMIQGFPVGDELSRLRNDLREAFSENGLGDDLDRRYKIIAAHLTLARFSTPMDWKGLKSFLEAHRDDDFGATHVRSLQLIEGDWYASADTIRILSEYPLR